MEKYVPLVRLSMVREKKVPYTAEMINKPEKAAELAHRILKGADREYLLVISIDSKCRPLAVEIVSIGTVNATMAEAREVFKHAILVSAAAILLAHNHLSGDCTPAVYQMDRGADLSGGSGRGEDGGYGVPAVLHREDGHVFSDHCGHRGGYGTGTHGRACL